MAAYHDHNPVGSDEDISLNELPIDLEFEDAPALPLAPAPPLNLVPAVAVFPVVVAPVPALEAQVPAVEAPAIPLAQVAPVPVSASKSWFSFGKTNNTNNEHVIDINLMNRDSKSINNHIQFEFEDIFGEADSQQSWDCVWRLNYRVFTWTRLFVYRLLSLLALPFTIIFAIFFGLVSCLNVFIIVPFAKLLSIPGNGLGLVWNWLIHTIFDPIASSIGLLFLRFGNAQERTNGPSNV